MKVLTKVMEQETNINELEKTRSVGAAGISLYNKHYPRPRAKRYL